MELRRQANTFAAVAEEYIRDHVVKKRKGGEVERDIRREFISRWGHRPISDVTRSDVIELIKEMKGRGAPYQARNLPGYLKTLFDWAIEQDAYGLGASPCDRIRPSRLIGEKMVRKRVLTDDELRRVWQAAKEAGYPFGPLVQVLILTGQRKSEVAEASWDEIDLGLALWTISRERMKSDVPHFVPLAPKAVEILEALPATGAERAYAACPAPLPRRRPCGGAPLRSDGGPDFLVRPAGAAGRLRAVGHGD